LGCAATFFVMVFAQHTLQYLLAAHKADAQSQQQATTASQRHEAKTHAKKRWTEAI
jgi:hypothetical protein